MLNQSSEVYQERLNLYFWCPLKRGGLPVLFEDSLPTLIKLKGKGIKTGLISNLASPYKRPVKDLGLEKYFDVIVFSCDEGVAKPDASIYKFALEQLGSSSAEALMIGDSYRSDVEGALTVGMTGVQLVRYCRHKNRPKEIGGLNEILERV